MKKNLALLLIIIFFTAACGWAKPPESDDSRPVIFASFSCPLDFVKAVGGDNFSYIQLIPKNAHMHDFEPNPSDIANAANAALFFYVSEELEPWIKSLESSLSPEKLIALDTSEPSEELGPHVWLDPELALEMYREACESLCAVDPENSSTYEKNLSVLEAKIMELDEAYKKTVSELRSKKIVVTHSAYARLCARYGLTELAIFKGENNSEPLPSALADIINHMKAEGIGAVFTEPGEPEKTAELIAKESGAVILELDPFESSDGSYFDVMYTNLEMLERGLN